ncbi:MAG: hypothetical protein D3922_00605 [Candidatus Electrothrix sp. AR1]|nr:hypothetical protein [Candidatus Electrothrix sp. AR1]
MQFLAGMGVSSAELVDFKSEGLLFGVYEKAFNEYISLTNLDYPKCVTDSVVGLFLLICDLSINPVEGFPCDINDFPNFVYFADPGIRFELLCRAVGGLDRELHHSIKNYSKQEYMQVSSILLESAGLQQISEGWTAIEKWLEQSEELRLLMIEHEKFEFGKENTLLRVLLSSFVSFTQDKREHPEFFCWPGHWKSNRINGDKIEPLWVKHLSLFTDAENNDGIFIRNFSGKSDKNLQNTLINFFSNNLIYDLSRQWALKEDEFLFDFRWLSESIASHESKEWGNEVFKKMYGVSIDSITV